MTLGAGLSFPRPIKAAWSPLRLFQNNEVGVWYDPSDYTTLFQTFASGTALQPVTGVEQPVGLILDKSKGLAVGAELLTNGGLTVNTTGWTAVNSPTLSNGVNGVTITNNGATYGLIYQAVTTVVDQWYLCTVTIVSGGTPARFEAQTAIPASILGTGVNVTSSGTYSFYYCATATTTYFMVGNRNDTNASNTFGALTVKAISGNHASQSTSTKRPVLRARYNLLTYSEQFDNAAWLKSSVTVSTGANDPNGGTTAATVTATANYGNIQQVASIVNLTVTSSIWIRRRSGSGSINLYVPNGSTNISQAVTSTWTRFSTSGVAGASNAKLVIELAVSGDAIDIAFGQINYGSTATTYQQITTATSYNSTGFLPYLAFDGVDDALATANINFNNTNKMSVFSGLTNNSDAAYGIVYELSTDYNTNNGVFSFIAANPAGVFTYASKGTSGNGRTASGYPAPTNPLVITGQSDIGAPTISIRVNGTTIDSATTTQGTGNYGNYYPLYIGARAGASAPFNGNLYSLIIRGANTSSTDVATTETWVNSKTGAWTVPAASLNLQFAGATSLDPSITFSRGSPATYLGSNGLVQWAAMNDMTYSEQFDNAAWSKVRATVSANSATAPDGTMTADKLVLDSTASATHYTSGSSSVNANITYTASIYAKAAELSYVALAFGYNSGGVAFNLANGTIAATTFGSGTITSVGNGWYRCSLTGVPLNNTAILVILSTGSVFGNINGDGTSGVYVWGAQVEAGSSANAYIKTTSSSYYAPRFSYYSRRNIQTYSQNFTNSVWVKGGYTVSGNATIAPDGTLTAGKIVSTSGSAGRSMQSNTVYNPGISAPFSFSIYVKAAEYSLFQIFDGGNGNFWVKYDLAALTATTAGGNGTAFITPVGNGWFRCGINGNTQTGSASRFCFAPYPAGATTGQYNVTFTGDGTSGMYFWGAQIEQSGTTTAYIPTTSTALPAYSPAGLLVEESRINICPYSQQIGTGTGWATNGNATWTANFATAPDGTTTAARCVATSGDGTYRSGITVSNATAYSFSVWIKWVSGTTSATIGCDNTGAGSNASITFNMQTGTWISSASAAVTFFSIVPYADSWYRVSVTFTTAGTSIPVIIYQGGSATFYAWGAQLEAVVNSTSSSYIPTNATTATRNADAVNFNVGTWFNTNQGTWVVSANQTNWLSNGARVIGYDGGGTPTPIYFSNQGNGTILVRSYTGATNLNDTANYPAVNTTFGSALAYTTSFRALCNSGGGVVTDNTAMPTPTIIYIGQNSLQNYLNGNIASITYYPAALPGFLLQQYTT